MLVRSSVLQCMQCEVLDACSISEIRTGTLTIAHIEKPCTIG